jgi:hypothetical protein
MGAGDGLGLRARCVARFAGGRRHNFDTRAAEHRVIWEGQ